MDKTLYTGPIVLPHDFRAACAMVEDLKADYESKAEGCFQIVVNGRLDPESEAAKMLKGIRDVARDKWQRHAKVLDRLRPQQVRHA